MPIENLVDLLKYYSNIRFVSYFTVAPTKDDLEEYFKSFSEVLEMAPDSKLFVLGYQIQTITEKTLPKAVSVFKSIEQFMQIL